VYFTEGHLGGIPQRLISVISLFVDQYVLFSNVHLHDFTTVRINFAHKVFSDLLVQISKSNIDNVTYIDADLFQRH